MIQRFSDTNATYQKSESWPMDTTFDVCSQNEKFSSWNVSKPNPGKIRKSSVPRHTMHRTRKNILYEVKSKTRVGNQEKIFWKLRMLILCVKNGVCSLNLDRRICLSQTICSVFTLHFYVHFICIFWYNCRNLWQLICQAMEVFSAL